MRRRDFVGVLAGAAAAPAIVRGSAACAQPGTIPVVGFLRSTSHGRYADSLLTALGQGLRETGFVERQNVAIDYRAADNRADRLPQLVTELIQRPVAVIVADNVAAIAAKAATTTVPIVFATGADPRQPTLRSWPTSRAIPFAVNQIDYLVAREEFLTH